MSENYGAKTYNKLQKTVDKNLKDFVQARQNYHCGDCGLPFGINREAKIFHLDNDPQNNKVSNLIVLCTNCHNPKSK